MDKKQLNVLISGASISGLCTAYWLAKYGFDVTVVERASNIRMGGQALDVRGPAVDVATAMGILDDIRTNSTKLTGMSILDASSGKETYRNTERSMTGGRFDSQDVEILRDDLCRILFDEVGSSAKYIFNDTIETLNQDESGVDITFAHAAPRRFDLVIGADGLRSTVRRLVFGPDEQFLRYLGHYVAIFTMPNFLGLDHWEVFVQHEGAMAAAIIVKDKDDSARVYLGFSADKPAEYDYRDIAAQKQLVADRNANRGWEFPRIIDAMQNSSNFYFDSMNQTIMHAWSKGRVVLIGDAGYSVSVSLGQGTTIAMVGAYVLAGELASRDGDVSIALGNYETELREYVDNNQKLAYAANSEPQQAIGESSGENMMDDDTIPDFGLSVIPYTLKNYKPFIVADTCSEHKS